MSDETSDDILFGAGETERLCECQHEPHPGEPCPEQVRLGGVLHPCGCDDRPT
jgi:hypothetical protein